MGLRVDGLPMNQRMNPNSGIDCPTRLRFWGKTMGKMRRTRDMASYGACDGTTYIVFMGHSITLRGSSLGLDISSLRQQHSSIPALFWQLPPGVNKRFDSRGLHHDGFILLLYQSSLCVDCKDAKLADSIVGFISHLARRRIRL